MHFLPVCILTGSSVWRVVLCAVPWGYLGLTSAAISLIASPSQCGRGEPTPVDAFTAKRRRDTLAKAVYERLFAHLVKCVNEAFVHAAPPPIAGTDRQLSHAERHIAREQTNFIGVLDIFGSEVFAVNSFEQLLINYANDKLQHYFTDTTITKQTQMFCDEGIDVRRASEQ